MSTNEPGPLTMTPDIPIRGTLLFHSETGTEGGWYAWQDTEHTHSGSKGDRCPWDSKWCPVTHGTWHQHSSYNGLHMLNDGDHLRVFKSHTPETLWAGTVRLIRRADVYRNPEATINGMWVNQEPNVGVGRDEWASWFFDELPCEITPPPDGDR